MNAKSAIAGFLFLGAAWVNAEVPTYRVQYLGDGWTATGINRFGDVCGSMSPDGTALLAGVSHNGAPFELLPLPPGMESSRAHDISDAGVIVGSVCPNQYVITQPTAAVWRPVSGGYTVEVREPLPGDLYCAAYAVNNVGDVVGASGYWGWNLSTGVQFTGEGTIRLPEGVIGSDINDQRVIIAHNRLLDLDTGVFTDIPLPPGNWQGFVAAALNNNNDFCGYILGYSGCSTFPMRYRQGVDWEYLGGCATTTSATAINDRGDALSYYYYTASGVTFVPEGYFGLGELIDGSQGEWYVQWGGANGINHNRQVIAAARQGVSGPIGAILMTPMNTGPDCGAVAKFSARCRDGKLTAKVVSALPAGTELTVTRNGGDAKTLTINDRGKGKVKWSGQIGAQTVVIAECSDWSQTTECS
ncbi:MAG: hypothetical protein IT449_09595 [Phycisphaerales bacterium]|nr:hypothetical protein [Phycisphaerales bacterium]